MSLFLPDYVKTIIKTLEKNGYKGYAVGGCVRDMIIGKIPHDYDVATDALPEAVEAMFERTIPTGIKHGTVTVLSAGFPIEVTTFRTESGYTDSRRPDSVNFVSDIKDDLSRRDFTVNAIAYNDDDGLIDPFGGCGDIDKRLLRAVGEPNLRFSEDALRILRLFRFSSQFGFTPECNTLDAAFNLSEGLKKISRERIASELLKAVCGDNPDALLPLLNHNALDFLGLSAPLSLAPLSKLKPEENIRLSAFTILCNADVESFSHELKLSNNLRNYLTSLTSLYNSPPKINRPDIKLAMHLYGGDRTSDYFRINEALNGIPTNEALELISDIITTQEPYTLSMLAVNGNMLSEIGIHGKDIGDALNHLLEAVINTPSLNTKEKLLEIAAKLP